MSNGTNLTAGLNRSQMALLNYLCWLYKPDLNDHSQVKPLVDSVINYTIYKKLLKSVKVTDLIEESPVE